MITIILAGIIVLLVVLLAISVIKIRKADRKLEESFNADMEEIKTDYNED
jgi:heme/copper-type cytochrome/quinol oxidase subunit 2